MQQHFAREYPKAPEDSDGVHRAAIRAKALDTLRGLLPAATQSNVGHLRHRPGASKRCCCACARIRSTRSAPARDQMLAELRKVIPAFLDARRSAGPRRPLERRTSPTRATARAAVAVAPARRRRRPSRATKSRSPTSIRDGEIKVVAAALYAVDDLPDDQLLAHRAPACRPTIAPRCSAPTSASAATAATSPGRAFERTSYRFDVLTDYGAFRDLQRHRLLTLEWQPLSTRHGYTEPDAIREAGALDDWTRGDGRLGGTARGAARGRPAPTPRRTPSSMAYRVRFYMEMNAREAMHVIELRTAPQGHPAYRRVCQQMHRLIADSAGHTAIAARDAVRRSLGGGARAAAVGAGAGQKRRRRIATTDCVIPPARPAAFQ